MSCLVTAVLEITECFCILSIVTKISVTNIFTLTITMQYIVINIIIVTIKSLDIVTNIVPIS